MSFRFSEEEERPPSLPPYLPTLPQQLSRPRPDVRPVSQQKPQRHARNRSNSVRQEQYLADATSMTTPMDLAGTRTQHLAPGRSRNAMATLNNLMEQARVSSPIKSDRGSTAESRRGSTSRSKQSGRSQQSAMTAQAQLEALDQKTARSEIESRSERNFFKMSGQIPPTPTTGELITPIQEV